MFEEIKTDVNRVLGTLLEIFGNLQNLYVTKVT